MFSKNLFKTIFIYFICMLGVHAQDAPEYYTLLNKEVPNYYDIVSSYDSYYESHEWEKNEYTRAFLFFVRTYSMSSFDENGNPIKVGSFLKKGNQKIQGIGKEWKALDVKIDRSDCYYTGQNGVVRSIAVHPTNPNIVFAGGLNGGLWKSQNKGQTWSESLLKEHPFVRKINKIVIAVSNPDYVYVATNAGILKSTDGGDSFTMTTIDYTSRFPSIDYGGDDYRSEYMYVDVSSTNENLVIASDINPQGLVAKVAHSVDGGQTWSKYTFGYKKFVIDVKFHPTNPSIIYTLVLENKDINFYRSTNRGLTFTRVTNGFANFTNPNNKEIRGKIALTPAQPDLVAFYLNVSDEGAAFYKSVDSGASFSRACCGAAAGIVNKSAGDRDFFGEGFSAVQIRWATTIAISNVDPNFVIAATNVQPRFSFDQMQTWYWTGEQVSLPKRPKVVLNDDQTCGTDIHGDIQDMIINGNDVWVANDGGITLSEDGGKTFVERADGLPITMALGFDMTPGKRDIIVAAMDHNGVIVRDEDIYGAYWKPLGGGDASNASINPIDDSWLYARPSGDNIIKRPSSGPSHGHPSYQQAGVNFGSGYTGRHNNVQFHPNQYYTLYSVDYKGFAIKKSIDNGVSWTALITLESGSSWSYAEVKVSVSNPDVIYVVDQLNNVNKLSKSVNGGTSWVSVLPSGLASNVRIRNIEIDSKNSDVIWLSTNGSSPKIYKSVNGGTSWVNYSTGLGAYKITSMIHQKGSDGGVYVGTQYGVYYRDNSKSSWEIHGTKLPGINMKFLKINYAKSIIRAGTTRGIWENDLAKSSSPQSVISSNTSTTTCGGDAIDFASASALFEDQSTSYLWIFEGGVPATSTQERQQVYYPVPGTYKVSLTVIDKNGTDTQVLTDFITVTGTCSSSEEIALTNISDVGGVACQDFLSPKIEVFNKSLLTINTYVLELYINGQVVESRNISTTLISGAKEEVVFSNVDISKAWRLKFVVSKPNGVTDDLTDNEIVSYLPTKNITIPTISTVSYSSASSGKTPDKAVDGDNSTIWHNKWSVNAPLPHELVFDLNDSYSLSEMEMLNRQNNSNGYPKNIEIYTSVDNVTWSNANPWTFAKTSSWQTAYFSGRSGIRYIKLVITSTISGSNVCSIAELKFKGCNNLITFIDAGSISQEISVYPNPTNEYLNINGLGADMHVKIFDILGLIVYEGSSSNIDVGQYASGTYILQVLDGDNVIVKKWLKK